MTNNRWTFVCISKHDRPVRQFKVSVGLLRILPSMATAVITVVAALAMIVAIEGSSRFEVAKVQADKVAMSREVESIRTRVAQLEASIDGFIESDERFRVVAGLKPIDAEIFEVGVGGPGMITPDSYSMWETDPATAEAVFTTAYDLGALERRATLLSVSMGQSMESLVTNYARLEATPSIVPTAGQGLEMISSGFSKARFHPLYHEALPHVGIDLGAVMGTPILSAAKGVVSYAGWKSGYGYTVEVEHGFGYMTRYAHALTLLVEPGQAVERNEVLAQIGRSGTATASHLHYEVWVNGVAENPFDYILNGVIP
jgi:murein DD-endopeptidase MepM/ murein hydrolase activator NlpD